jgi:DNA-binding HxlR family transcriptional regulator
MKESNSKLSEKCKTAILGIRDVQDIMSGKWKYLIVSALYYTGKRRFMDLKRHINDIAPKVLSKELKDLEMNHLITRTICDTKPITVEYELTKLGKSLKMFIEPMAAWGVKYRKAIIKEVKNGRVGY